MKFDLTTFILDNKGALHEILDLIPIPLFVKDITGKYITCNHLYEVNSGKSRQELLGKTVYDLWPKEQAHLFFLKDQELFDSPGFQKYQADISLTTGSQCIVEFHKSTFKNSKGKIIGLLGAIFDITEKINLETELKRLSEIDDLTGLANRRAGRNLLEQVFNQNQRNKGIFVIATLDIDDFKSINDNYGHSAGDAVLRKIDNITSKVLRDCDIILRQGGEEFILCFPETNLSDSLIVLERIRHLFENEKIALSKDQDISITVSIGVSEYPQHGQSVEKLIVASDKAMYHAKNSGRNCIKTAVEKD
jgi:diguanylate cyclase (GGDEF)-like protein/PAS domain S-box-containing protein